MGGSLALVDSCLSILLCRALVATLPAYCHPSCYLIQIGTCAQNGLYRKWHHKVKPQFVFPSIP